MERRLQKAERSKEWAMKSRESRSSGTGLEKSQKKRSEELGKQRADRRGSVERTANAEAGSPAGGPGGSRAYEKRGRGARFGGARKRKS